MIRLPDIKTAVTPREAEALASLAAGHCVLEVGSLLGFSTIVMAQAARVVHSVDPHDGYPEDNPRPTLTKFYENLRWHGVEDRVVIHVGTDMDVLPMLRPAMFDFAFVDLSLTDGTTKRVVTWVQHLIHHYGSFAVHDYGHPEWPGATQVVDALGRPFELVDTLAIFTP